MSRLITSQRALWRDICQYLWAHFSWPQPMPSTVKSSSYNCISLLYCDFHLFPPAINRVDFFILFIFVYFVGGSNWSSILLISVRICSHLSSIMVLSREHRYLSSDYQVSFQSKNCGNSSYQHLEDFIYCSIVKCNCV